MDVRIAVASDTLGSGFTGAMLGLVRKHLRPGQTIAECATVTKGMSEVARGRLLSLLRDGPKPRALVGICIKPDAPTVAAFRAAGVPVVLIDEQAEGASTVASDNFAGGYLAGRHLVGLGRRRIAVVAGNMLVDGGYNALQRAKGFQKALAEGSLPFALDEVLEAPEYARQDGVAAMQRILDEGKGVDAIFCAAGDVCASGLLAAARERNVRVPEHVAVLGYDDNPLASISDPPLSTIRQPLEQIAGEALRLATDAAAEALAKPKTVLFDPKLVLRRSA
jgi:DNA-binding LacI/PurR family transcriptional regulator